MSKKQENATRKRKLPYVRLDTTRHRQPSILTSLVVLLFVFPHHPLLPSRPPSSSPHCYLALDRSHWHTPDTHGCNTSRRYSTAVVFSRVLRCRLSGGEDGTAGLTPLPDERAVDDRPFPLLVDHVQHRVHHRLHHQNNSSERRVNHPFTCMSLCMKGRHVVVTMPYITPLGDDPDH